MSLISQPKREKSVTKVSEWRGRPAKKDTAKSKKKHEENRSKKRPVSTNIDNESPSKTLETEPKANISKKVGGANFVSSTVTPREIIEISDSESEDDQDARRGETNQEQPPAPAKLQYLKAGQPQKKVQVPSKPLGTIAQDTDCESSKADSPYSASDLTPGLMITHTNEENGYKVRELRNARWDLQAVQDGTKKLRQEMEERDADFHLEKTKSDAEARHDVANSTGELGNERQRSLTLAAERDQLRRQLEKNQDILDKNAGLENELQSLQERYDEEREFRREEQQNHAAALDDILQSKSKSNNNKDTRTQVTEDRVRTLEDDKARLVKEIKMLKAVTASRDLLTLSPVSSQAFATDEDKREDNVRKMYVKTKRQYDILQSAANNLATCTSSMDLSSFGEFGRYMKKLRTSLDLETADSGHEKQALVLQKPDDDEGGSERFSQ